MLYSFTQGSAGRDGVLGRSSDGPRPGTSEDEDVEKLFWDGTGRPRTSPEKNADLRGPPRTSEDLRGRGLQRTSWSGPGLVRGPPNTRTAKNHFRTGRPRTSGDVRGPPRTSEDVPKLGRGPPRTRTSRSHFGTGRDVRGRPRFLRFRDEDVRGRQKSGRPADPCI